METWRGFSEESRYPGHISYLKCPRSQLVVLLVAGVHAARLGPGHGAAGGGGGAAGQGAALLHDRGRGGSATVAT